MGSRRLTDEELLDSFNEGLNTLAHLAAVYDGGYAPICFAMATEVQKLLTENNAAIKLRAERTFSTIDYGGESTMLNAMYKLTAARIGGLPTRFLLRQPQRQAA